MSDFSGGLIGGDIIPNGIKGGPNSTPEYTPYFSGNGVTSKSAGVTYPKRFLKSRSRSSKVMFGVGDWKKRVEYHIKKKKRHKK